MEPESSPATESRPLSGTEYSWYRAVPTGTGITVLALLLSRSLPLPNLQNALRRLLASHPVLASSLSPASVLLLHPQLGPAVPITTNPLPPHAPLLLHPLLELELNLNPWRVPEQQIPNFFATVYEGPPDRPVAQAVALRFHTAVCDRTSAVAIMKELMEIMAADEGGEDVDVVLKEGRVNLGIEELIRREDAWKPFWAKGKDILGYSINGLRSSGLGFEVVGVERSSEVVRLVMGETETKKLLYASKAKGVKLCAAFAAAGLIATYSSKHLENNQPETYSVVTLIDCRKFLDPVLNDHDLGFYHSAILNMHTVHGQETLWELASRCHDAYSNAKANKKHLTDINELNYLMSKAIDYPHLTPSSSMRTALISVFEEPVLYETSELQSKLGVEDYVSCASVHGVGPSIAIFDTIRDGKLDCVFVYPSPIHSRKQITELVEHMEKILVEESCYVDVEEDTAL